jgi:inorganic pyrophosphatase
MKNPAFWSALEKLVQSSRIVIDRGRGVPHPRWSEVIYPLDYGFLEGTTSGDGQGIDVWIGAGGSREVVGIVCTADATKRDAELKILLGCSSLEIALVERFLNETVGLPCVVIERSIDHL